MGRLSFWDTLTAAVKLGEQTTQGREVPCRRVNRVGRAHVGGEQEKENERYRVGVRSSEISVAEGLVSCQVSC